MGLWSEGRRDEKGRRRETTSSTGGSSFYKLHRSTNDHQATLPAMTLEATSSTRQSRTSPRCQDHRGPLEDGYGHHVIEVTPREDVGTLDRLGLDGTAKWVGSCIEKEAAGMPHTRRSLS